MIFSSFFSCRISMRIWLLGIAGVFILTSCFNAAAEQRQAFIQMLQAGILDQQGVRVPRLTPEQRELLGSDYGKQYDILYNFSKKNVLYTAWTAVLKPVKTILQSDIPAERQEKLDTAIQATHRVLNTLNAAYNKTVTKKNALIQAEELKAVYDRVFNKVVSAPVIMAQSCITDLKRFLESVKDVNDFVLAHPNGVRYRGNRVILKGTQYEKDISSLLRKQKRQFDVLQQRVEQIKEMLNEG